MKIALIASNRPLVLQENLHLISRLLPMSLVYIFLDLPNRGLNTECRQVVRNATRHANVEIFIMARHIGTRSLWLSILSMRPPLLVLEDDVFVTPNANHWYSFCVERMNEDRRLFGCSFQSQPTVAKLNSQYKLNYQTPYKYPLVGSHGFMISPFHHQEFVDNLQIRQEESLNIPDLITTKWYNEFKRQKLTQDRMWTQEAVSYVYHRRLTVLYPPTAHPYSIHCASEHNVDKLVPKCHNIQNTTYTLRDYHSIPETDWAAMCLENCPKPSTPTLHGNSDSYAQLAEKAYTQYQNFIKLAELERQKQTRRERYATIAHSTRMGKSFYKRDRYGGHDCALLKDASFILEMSFRTIWKMKQRCQ
jgi:GR25 family glycosyltransferase involved in LPS biosynthesis